MDDIGHFTKLQYEQDKVLQENQDAQEIRKKIKDDYVKLQNKLETLPDALSENVMVPIGNVGFFPGHLLHTNEIMVLLGDNWFVERTAKQSIEIIDRRIKLAEKQISDLQKEYSNVKAQREYTDEFRNIKEEVGGVQEIKEELPDELVQDTTGRTRKAHVPRHDLIPRSVKFRDGNELVKDIANDISNPNSDTIDHNELFARLNELEREEQEEEDRLHAKQMKEISDGNYEARCSTSNDYNGTSQRHVQFKKDLRNYSSRSCDIGDDPESSRNTITFTHTPYPQRGRSASESDLRMTVKTPADIFEQFASKASQETDEKPLKSILKKDSRSNSNENLRLKPILKTSPEHQPGTPEQIYFDDPRPILKTPPDSQGSDRRPGTPEYTLNDDRKSILKSNNGGTYKHGTIVCDTDTTEHRTILKFQDMQLNNTNEMLPECGEEMRSILKSGIESKNFRHVTTQEDIPRQENRKTILRSQEWCKVNNESLERKTILKNPSGEAISERVVERGEHSAEMNDPEVKSNQRPMSKFRASRLSR